jgi:hypothetical protein
LTDLLNAIPGVVEFRQSLGIAQTSLGTSFHRYGYNVDAMELLDRAFFEFQKLYSETNDLDDLHWLADAGQP